MRRGVDCPAAGPCWPWDILERRRDPRVAAGDRRRGEACARAEAACAIESRPPALEPASELSAGRIVADREGRSSGRASERASEPCASDFGVASGRGPGRRPSDSAGDDLPCSHGRHGAGYVRSGVTTPVHGGHGAGHGATHGFDGAGHGDHGGAERRAGPDSAAATAAGAAAFTIPYQGLEVKQPPPTNPCRQRCVAGGGPARAKREERARIGQASMR